jgi:GDP-L-fucose synthase
MHVDDLAGACLFLMQNYNEAQFVNVGTGVDVSIKELALLIKKVVGFEGELTFNTDKPDGTPRKLMDVSLLNSLGYTARISLEEGIRSTYQDFLAAYADIAG